MTIWPFPTAATAPQAVLPRPMPGVGTRLTLNQAGYSYSVDRPANLFRHPFRASLGIRTVTLALGLVDGIEPQIGGKPMSKTTLEIDFGKANAAGESYVVLEVVPNQDGVLAADSIRRVVHQTGPVRSNNPALGKRALALIVWRNRKPFLLEQIVTFNLAYERVLPEPGRGVVRHLFL